MDKYEFKSVLLYKLGNLDFFKKAGQHNVVIRCPICGDTDKRQNDGHFYVKINMQEDEPILFHCFLCENSGLLNPSILRMFGINDMKLNGSMLSYNKKSMKNMSKEFGITDNEFNLTVPMPDINDARVIQKKEYIERRLGIKTTFEELVNQKVVFSLGQFLHANDISRLTVGKDRAALLHNDYVGFLSTRNEFIIFRNILENSNRRYDKYSVFNNLDNTRKTYTIPNTVDLLTTKRVTLNIAEGTFDIHGVYNHIYERDSKNKIFAAASGSGFITVVQYFIKMGLIGNIDVNLYADQDKSPKFYEAIKTLRPWVNDINLFYNDKSKDYGVPKDLIRIKKRRI